MLSSSAPKCAYQILHKTPKKQELNLKKLLNLSFERKPCVIYNFLVALPLPSCRNDKVTEKSVKFADNRLKTIREVSEKI
jgi:hypothetical protein